MGVENLQYIAVLLLRESEKKQNRDDVFTRTLLGTAIRIMLGITETMRGNFDAVQPEKATIYKSTSPRIIKHHIGYLRRLLRDPNAIYGKILPYVIVLVSCIVTITVVQYFVNLPPLYKIYVGIPLVIFMMVSYYVVETMFREKQYNILDDLQFHIDIAYNSHISGFRAIDIDHIERSLYDAQRCLYYSDM
jgi:hypothetical protein